MKNHKWAILLTDDDGQWYVDESLEDYSSDLGHAKLYNTRGQAREQVGSGAGERVVKVLLTVED